jgi:cell division protein FtsA
LVIGKGEVATQGVCKGKITSVAQLKISTHKALAQAEQVARVHLSESYFSFSGEHLSGQTCRGVASVAAADGSVSLDDIRRAQEEAKRHEMPYGFQRVFNMRQPFRLDGVLCAKPLNKRGRQLEARYWEVSASIEHTRDLEQVTNTYSLAQPQLIASGIASGLIVADKPQRDSGVLVVDIGAGTTDYVLYRHGAVYCAGALPIGGYHITNDLRYGLNISLANAERIKCEQGSAVVRDEDADKTHLLYYNETFGNRSFASKTINQIINARVDELFGFLKNRVGDDFFDEGRPAEVVLTGGSSALRDIAQVAAQVLGAKVRLANDYPIWVRDDLVEPKYSTVLGVLDLAVQTMSRTAPAASTGHWGKALKWIQRNFRV